MPRVYEVKKARKDYPEFGIKDEELSEDEKQEFWDNLLEEVQGMEPEI